jgi:hypothetical protein
MELIKAIAFLFGHHFLSFNHLEIREEQDLLEILDLDLFGAKILVSILIETFLATEILLDSCLV